MQKQERPFVCKPYQKGNNSIVSNNGKEDKKNICTYVNDKKDFDVFAC